MRLVCSPLGVHSLVIELTTDITEISQNESYKRGIYRE